jgi:hypothetical protein
MGRLDWHRIHSGQVMLFFAYSIKDTVIDWLDPKPVPCQNQDGLCIPAAEISWE